MSISASRPKKEGRLLSVIIPCHNVARWLGRCLDETFTSLPDDGEVIAVDDGSTDSTANILFEYALSEPRIRVIRQPNKFLSAARNAGLNAARGKYIFFIDADDGVEPDFFSSMLEKMEEKNADYCLCATRERADLGTHFRNSKLKGDYNYQSNAEIVEKYLPRIFGYSFDDIRRWYGGEGLFARREMASVCRACFRRDIIEKFGIRFDETVTYYEDAMFNAEYLVHCNSMSCVDLPLYRVTAREGSMMKTVPKDKPRYAANKLRLLECRKMIDRLAEGRLTRQYEATNVLSAMELMRIGRFEELKMFLKDPVVKDSFKGFPISVKHPLVAITYLILKIWKNFL